MQSVIRSLWQNTVGLFVDDGYIAVGTLAAVVMVGLWAGMTTAETPLRDLGGPLLFVFLIALLVINVYGAARAAARRRVDESDTAEPSALGAPDHTRLHAIPVRPPMPSED